MLSSAFTGGHKRQREREEKRYIDREWCGERKKEGPDWAGMKDECE